MADSQLQSIAYREVRESLHDRDRFEHETVDYRGEIGKKKRIGNGRNKSTDSETGTEFMGGGSDGKNGGRGRGAGVPEVVQRLGDRSLEKQEKLERLRLERDVQAAKELKHKPQITPYDYESLDRVPLHKRDYGNLAEKKTEEQKRNMLIKKLKEQDECTFSPNINKNKGENIRAKTPSELMEWRRERDNMKAMKRIENPDIGGAECTFQPSINEKSKRLAMNHNSGDGIPLRRTKQQYIEEYIKKEKEELFKPKVNVTARKIVKTGYDKPAEIEVRQINRRPRQQPSKSTIQKRNISRDTSSHRFDPEGNPISMTAEEIIERYRREAKPKLREVKIPFSRNRSKETIKALSADRIKKKVPVLSVPKKLGAGRSTSKDELKDILLAASKKLEREKKNQETPKSPRRKDQIASNLDDLKTSSLTADNCSSNCYRFDREASLNQTFNNDHWFEQVKDRNAELMKKKVEDLIYRDSPTKKSVNSSTKKSKASGMPLKLSRTAHN